jgi:hypothetical protein
VHSKIETIDITAETEALIASEALFKLSCMEIPIRKVWIKHMHSTQRSIAAVLCCAMLSSAAEVPIGRAVKYSRDVQETAKGGEDSFIPDEKGRVIKARLDRPIPASGLMTGPQCSRH